MFQQDKFYESVTNSIFAIRRLYILDYSLNNEVKIIVTDYLEPDLEWEKEQLKKYPCRFFYYQLKDADEDTLISKIKDADILVVNMVKMTERVINTLERCKLIIRHGTGYDNLDIAACTRKGIIASYIPDYCIDEVAEHAIGLMMALAKKLMILDRSMHKIEWDYSCSIPVFTLKGKNLGIVGCGRIGSSVVRIMRGLQMNYLVYDPYLAAEKAKEYNIKLVDFESLLTESDIITIHAPLTDETTFMFDIPQFKKMKETAFIINTARGPIIKEKALVKALHSGWIAGAGIDVYQKEPPIIESTLVTFENVILTPHAAWYSVESAWTIREKILEDIIRFFNGQKPRFPINKEVSY